MVGDELAALCADDLAVIEKHAPRLRVVPEQQRPRQTRILNRLDCVEYADGCQIAGESNARLIALCFRFCRRVITPLPRTRPATRLPARPPLDALVQSPGV